MSTANWGRLALLSVLWGGSFLFAAVAIKGWPAGAGNGLPPLTVVQGRVIVAALTLLILLVLLQQPLPRGAAVWRAFFVMGLLNNVLPFSLIFSGQSLMPARYAAGLASILNATTPLFTVLAAHWLTADERLNRLKLAGVVIGFVGVATMLGLGLLTSPDLPLAGMALCLSAALVYAFAGLYGRRFRTLGVTPLQTAFGQVMASSLIMLPLVTVIERPWALATPGLVSVLAVAALGVFRTGLAYVLFFRIPATAGATNLLLVTFLIPVSAILMGVLLLGERLRPEHLAGMAMIGLGLAAIDGRLFRRREAAPPG
jgi:drug/metabolite transporter (DMT)-like permease